MLRQLDVLRHQLHKRSYILPKELTTSGWMTLANSELNRHCGWREIFIIRAKGRSCQALPSLLRLSIFPDHPCSQHTQTTILLRSC